MKSMFGAAKLRTKPKNAINVPAIVMTRHPNLLVRALTIGPKHVFDITNLNHATIVLIRHIGRLHYIENSILMSAKLA